MLNEDKTTRHVRPDLKICQTGFVVVRKLWIPAKTFC